MKEKMTKTGKRRYEAPTSWLIHVDAEHQLLAGSPPARPGGNRSGRITITPHPIRVPTRMTIYLMKINNL